MKITKYGLGLLLALLCMANSALSQEAQRRSSSLHDQLSTRLNANTVTVISGNPNGTYLKIAYDLSAVLDEGDNLRVLPIIGKGGAQNIRDVLYLKGVDMGITSADTMRYMKESGEAGHTIEQSLRFIARIYNEEMHLLARPEIKRIQDLEGKVVNLSDAGSGSQMTAHYVLKALGITVKEVNMGQADALEKMKTGEVVATFLVAGKPAPAFANIKANDQGFAFVPIPFSVSLPKEYLPARLTSKEYPVLVPEGGEIETMASGVVLMSYNWPEGSEKYRRVAAFVDAFYAKLDKFQGEPRHPKWAEMNFASDVPGWIRFARAQQLIDAEKQGADKQPDDSKVRAEFKKFLSTASNNGSPKSPAEQEELFKQFKAWSESRRQ